MAVTMAQTEILIKKYENRRLYDTTNSRYVNLDEVAQMLRRGDEVRVVDASTGEDITRLILTQIIVEDAKLPDSSFPLDILRQMVIASGRASQESALKYMKAMFDMYQNSYRAMPPPFNPFEFMQTANRPPNAVPAAPQPAVPSENTAGRTNGRQKPEASDVDELKARLAELEKLVTGLKPRKPAARKK